MGFPGSDKNDAGQKFPSFYSAHYLLGLIYANRGWYEEAKKELEKVKNRTESVITFEDMSVMSRANSLAMYELLGDANLMNTELQRYQEITAEDICTYANKIFSKENSSTIHYYSQQ